jgi:DNA-binding NtrC family response regulator
MSRAGSTPPNNLNSLCGARILVVEEELMICWLAEEALMGAGCDVIGPAQSFAEGERLIAETAIDAALVDGTIRGVPALDFADFLTQKNIPFAVMTAGGRYRPKGIPLPAFRDAIFLDKPFTNEQIVATVAALLDRSSRARANRTAPPPASSRRSRL